MSLALLALLLASCEKENPLARYDHSLAVVEIEIDEKYLWSPDSGLYVIGCNGIPRGCNPSCPANYNQSWEYPALVRFTPPGKDVPALEERVGFRIKGNCSRVKAMKSIGLYWRNEYGNPYIDYPFFPGSGVDRFKRILLRNSGNDFGLTHMKDAAVTRIIQGHARVDFQAYSPVVLYLNGEYWGIHNMREMITPDHFRYHYGVDDEKVDLLEGSPLSPVADDGFTDAFLEEVIGFLENSDLSLKENYLAISERIDIGNYIDYIIIETYVCNMDWPVTNSRWWREDLQGSPYARWRWVTYDHDVAFCSKHVEEVWIGDLHGKPHDPSKAPGFHIFNQLIRNDDFRQEFLARYIYFIEFVFNPDRVDRIIMDMMSSIRDEYPRHQEKWHTLPRWQWESAVKKIATVNRERNEIMESIIYDLYEER